MTTCTVCRRPDADAYACTHCVDRLADTLHDIQHQTEQLSAVPTMARPNGTRGGTLASQRSPARLDVLTLTDPRTRIDDTGTLSVLGVLTGWARTIREDRALDWPERVTVTTERRLLTTHLDWAAHQPWADEMAHELFALHRQLQRANGTLPDPPMGRCYLPAHEDTPCAGPIWIDHANGHAHCGRCRATWNGSDLHRLALILEQEQAEARRPRTDDGRPMLTAQELADETGASINAVRLRLSRAGHRATNGHYHPDALSEKVSA